MFVNKLIFVNKNYSIFKQHALLLFFLPKNSIQEQDNTSDIFFPPSFMFAHWNLCTWSICCEFTSHPLNLQRIKIASIEWATVSNRKSIQIKAFKQLFFMIALLLWLLPRKREGRGKSGSDSFIIIRTVKTILDLPALQRISAN